MRNHSSKRNRVPRLALLLALSTALANATGCNGLKSFFTRPERIEVPALLTPIADATTAQLTAEVNRLAAIKSIRAKVDIEFQATSFAELGIAEKFKRADGTVYLQRPGMIYLKIQAPFIGTEIAEMASDGEHFTVAVLQGEEKYKRFVRGTNSAKYGKLTTDGSPVDRGKKKMSSDERTVGAVSNLRPQHLSDAFMVKPIAPSTESGLSYTQSELFQEEPDKRTGAKKGARVMRTYYLLDEAARNDDGTVRILRRFWFDRVGEVRLARLQSFDNTGRIVTDVSYGGIKPFGESNRLMPASIELTRPQDGYKLLLSYQSSDAVTIDQDINPKAFVLENRWNLREVDLDTPEGRRAFNLF